MDLIEKVCLVILSLGILLLYVSYSYQQPIAVSELNEFIGETVMVSGKVVNTSFTKSGRPKLKIIDNTSYAYTVLLFNSTLNCSEITVRGRVENFNGKIYIFVYKNKDIIKCK